MLLWASRVVKSLHLLLDFVVKDLIGLSVAWLPIKTSNKLKHRERKWHIMRRKCIGTAHNNKDKGCQNI